MDPDPHYRKTLDPDPNKVFADPKHWYADPITVPIKQRHGLGSHIKDWIRIFAKFLVEISQKFCKTLQYPVFFS